MPTLTIGNRTANLPIVQGGMAVRISMAPLASAVARAGGIGLIAGSGLEPDEMRSEVSAARAAAGGGVVGVNIMVAIRRFKETVLAAIEGGTDLLVCGAGFSRDVFQWAAEADVPVVPIVGSARVATLSQRFGAAAVIVEGVEAGGHLGTDRTMLDLLPEIIEAVDIPVIGAGGVVTGSDIRRTLEAGAAGVQMGSRFAATVESSAPEAFKQMYVDATEEDIVIVRSPVGLPGRAISNPFSRQMAAGQMPPIGRCISCLKKCGKEYCIMERLKMAQAGDVVDGLVFAGSSAARVHDIPTAGDLIKRLVAEFEASGEGK
jgi:NAD(P)H-dependent flavin oxidoreductase YrpB (nitropropane dioxygenase family)